MARSSHYKTLKSKWIKRSDEVSSSLWNKHKDALLWVGERLPVKEKLASGAVGALMLANTLPGVVAAPAIKNEIVQEQGQQKKKDNRTEFFSNQLKSNLPTTVRPLTPDEEEKISNLLSLEFNVKATSTLDGKRLNTSYGYIGAEQHLARYPGDAMSGHLDESFSNNRYFYSSGMAPGLGAWGYFAPSKAQMTQEDSDREKWYIAVQTFDAPGFSQNTGAYSKWFKYRKMLVVNPATGQAVVCDVADAGPANWTGKQLGGSPEVMTYLDLHKGPRKGAVLYFFIDDPNDTIPLGPI